jgi:hypothetical protein
MVEPPFGALLVAAVGATSLAEPGVPATGETAIALAAIAARTQEELGAAVAVPANPRSEAIVRRRHAHTCRRQWTMAPSSWQVRTSLLWLPDEGCHTGTPSLPTAGFLLLPLSKVTLQRNAVSVADRTDDSRLQARMMSLGRPHAENYILQMIDRKQPGSKRLPSDLGDWPVKCDIEVRDLRTQSEPRASASG